MSRSSGKLELGVAVVVHREVRVGVGTIVDTRARDSRRHRRFVVVVV